MTWTKEKRHNYIVRYMKKYNKEHKKEREEYRKQWRAKNPDKIKEYDHRNRERHREKRNEYMKKWYQKNKRHIREYERNRRKSRKNYVDNLKKKNNCVICGYSDYRALEYHHKDPNNKTLGIFRMVSTGYTVKRIKEEIKKCILVCSNCHRILHWQE